MICLNFRNANFWSKGSAMLNSCDIICNRSTSFSLGKACGNGALKIRIIRNTCLYKEVLNTLGSHTMIKGS